LAEQCLLQDNTEKNTYHETILKENYSRSQSAQQENNTGSVVRSLRLACYNLNLRPAQTIKPNLHNLQIQKLVHSHRTHNQKTVSERTTSYQQSTQSRISIHTADRCILLVTNNVNTTQVNSRPTGLSHTRKSLVHSADQHYLQKETDTGLANNNNKR